MFKWLIRLLVSGECPACEERARQLAACQQQVSQLQDRLMSRNFGEYQMAQANADKVREETRLMKHENRLAELADADGMG